MIHVKSMILQHKIYIPLMRRRILFFAQSSLSKKYHFKLHQKQFSVFYKFSFDYYYVAKYFRIYYLPNSLIDITNCGFLIPEKSYTKRLKIMIMYIFVISIILFLALNIPLIITDIILPIYKEYYKTRTVLTVKGPRYPVYTMINISLILSTKLII